MKSPAELEAWNSYLEHYSYVGETAHATADDYNLFVDILLTTEDALRYPFLTRWHKHVRWLVQTYPGLQRRWTMEIDSKMNQEFTLTELSSVPDDELLHRVAARWTQRWTNFRRSFTFDSAVTDGERFEQLQAAGLSTNAANAFKIDPSTDQTTSVVLAKLRSFLTKKYFRVLSDLAFFQEELLAQSANLTFLDIVDIFNPNCSPPNLVSDLKRRQIVDELRRMQSIFEANSQQELTDDVVNHYGSCMALWSERELMCQRALEDLQQVLTASLQLSVTLVPFGSFVFGLSDIDSDLDCKVKLQRGLLNVSEATGDISEPSVAAALLSIALKDAPSGWQNTQFLNPASGPVVTVANPSHWPTVEIDLSFAEDVSVAAANLFRTLIESDERVAPLLMYLKRHMRERGLWSSREGGFSGYAYVSAMLAILSDLGVVPQLRSSLDKLPPDVVSGWNVASHKVPPSWRSSSTDPVGELVLKVLRALTTPNRVFAYTPRDELLRSGCCDGNVADNSAVSRGTAERAAVLVCSSTLTFRERDVLGRVAHHFSALVLNADEISSSEGTHKMLSSKLTYAIVMERRSIIVLVMTANGKTLVPLLRDAPPNTTFFVLQPELPPCKEAVQWQLLQSLANPIEANYRTQHRVPTKARVYPLPDEDLPSADQDLLTPEQHSQWSNIVRHLHASLERCLEMEGKLKALVPDKTHMVVFVKLKRFYSQVQAVPDVASKGLKELWRLKQGQGKINLTICQLLKDMSTENDFFNVSLLQPDAGLAIAEIISKLELVLPKR